MNKITTYYLEMNSSSALLSKNDSKGLEIRECETDQYQFNKFLYQLIGAKWGWFDKLAWTEENWKAYIEDDNLRTWVAYYKGTPVGYYELQRQEQGDIEIAYFGLAADFIGKGFGGYLLSQAIKSAWTWEGTNRVWLHTCSLDHSDALNNYKARGMKVYRVEKESKSHKSKLDGFIIDCNTSDLHTAAVFWGEALGLNLEVLPGEEGEKYLKLVDPFDEIHIEVQTVDHQSRVHLDIETDDIEAEVMRLEKIGAKKITKISSWCVMEAPTGQRFCVVPNTSSNFNRRAKQW
jgi:GNAT superfamily N-acetyltransferase